MDKTPLSNDAISLNLMVRNVVNGTIQRPSEEDWLQMRKHRHICSEALLSVLGHEMRRIDAKESDKKRLIRSLQLLTYLREPRTFPVLKGLCCIPVASLDRWFGDEFITEDLQQLLARTADRRWIEIIGLIEDQQIDPYIRCACIEALPILLADGAVSRDDLMDCFSELLNIYLRGHLRRDMVVDRLITTCSDMWPGECLVQIRECFEKKLVDLTFVDFNYVLALFHRGLDKCTADLRGRAIDESWLGSLVDEDEEW